MQKSDFSFNLPEELIAQIPLPVRSASRLLACHRNSPVTEDRQFSEISSILKAGDLLVFNNTRVIPARLYGKKDTGGQVEILLERILDDTRFVAMLRCSKTPQVGQKIFIADDQAVRYEGRNGDFFLFSREDGKLHQFFTEYGRMPLPPYIQRKADEQDKERYQTIFARKPGAVAAPTASLHFDEAILQSLQQKGVNTAEITLHVGAGTFQPLRVNDLKQHVMHAETFDLSVETVKKVQETKAAGGRVFSAGTTTLRALETASADGILKPMSGDTRLFITPGYKFNTVDGLITNFHLSESTLLMLVSAFAGVDEIRHIYRYAISKKYRFFSYGDAMIILPEATV
ncbi:MAG: tRNA preQ1(34) S-adenosylmethionine ribosyltransferase-isomerase QueA [Gammaproteobacteria bacterium]|nr:tRNA preQ1(34) S-adenosylmethionine ribosyltransferase-isomerase QueA [Gammaproteobacteria bacterium]